MDLNKCSKIELLSECERLGLTRFKSKSKSELIGLIEAFIDKKPTQTLNLISKSSLDGITILNNDCIEELKKLADGSIDLVLTDPPYFIDKLDSKWSSENINSDVKNSHIPLGTTISFKKIVTCAKEPHRSHVTDTIKLIILNLIQ